MSNLSPFALTSDRESLAVFDAERRYRYMLRRGAGHGSGLVNFILLNPSTADEQTNDPTIRRCISFAKAWGYADLVVTNLFAWRATDPSELRHAADPIGPDNDAHLLEWARKAGSPVCGWGMGGAYRGRAAQVQGLLGDAGIKLHALKLTKDGHPQHPLYLKAACLTFEWNPERSRS